MGELQTNNQYLNPIKPQNTPLHFLKGGIAIPVSWTLYLEYAGAGLGIAGWLGVRQIGSTGLQELGFLVWIISGLFLIAWGFRTWARGIMPINAVNVEMAASAFVGMV